jgi:hypothetical protein
VQQETYDLLQKLEHQLDRACATKNIPVLRQCSMRIEKIKDACDHVWPDEKYSLKYANSIATTPAKTHWRDWYYCDICGGEVAIS